MSILEAPTALSAADRAWEIYYNLRSVVETPENIGKLLLLDLGSGDYEIDDETSFGPVQRLQSLQRLQSRHSNSKLFALRIGYEAAMSFSGSMERLAK